MYLWIKVFHVFFLIAWFAGIFYIWRLFVYHSETSEKEVKNQLGIMEKRLYGIIMRPAAIMTLVSGFIMFFMNWNQLHQQIWMWLKIILVLLVFAHHLMANYFRKRLAKGDVFKGRFFRIMNEVPTILLLSILIMVFIRPF